MTTLPEPPSDLDRILVDHDRHVTELLLRCRTVILTAMGEATERVYQGWHGLGFHHPVAGYVCAVFPGEGSVRVGFEHGHLLSDPDGYLVGAGKQVRYLVVEAWDRHIADVLTELVAEAIRLG